MAKVMLVGLPNAGKSTLHNRLIGRKTALVGAAPGLTRDVRACFMRCGRHEVELLDTPGYLEIGEVAALYAKTAPQTRLAQRQANALARDTRRLWERTLRDSSLCLLVFDAAGEIGPLLEQLAALLRKAGKPVLVVANKMDKGTSAMPEAFRLGFGAPLGVSALHRQGIEALEKAMTEKLECLHPPACEQASAAVDSQQEDRAQSKNNHKDLLRLCIIGAPNAGKSTLVNRLLGEERLLTGPAANMTRDSLEFLLSSKGGVAASVCLIDTAGMRKRRNLKDESEILATQDSRKAIRFAHVAALAVDCSRDISGLDLRLAKHVNDNGRVLMILLTKWDGQNRDKSWLCDSSYKLRTLFGEGLVIIPVSAMTGWNSKKIIPAAKELYRHWNASIKTRDLMHWLQLVVAKQPPPRAAGHRPRLKFIEQINVRPPSFLLTATRPEAIGRSYKRYLEADLRRAFGLQGIALRLVIRPARPDKR